MKLIKNGQSLIEILLAFGLAAILLPAIFGGFITATEGKAQSAQRLQAVALLKEAEEATRSVREAGWNTFAVNGTYHIASNSGSWRLLPGSETINGFTRFVVISDVTRSSSSGQIVTTAGVLDTSTKKVVTTVSWGMPLASSVSSTDYYSRFVNNNAVTQTTQADFNLGTKNGTETTNTSGGEFQIQSWGAPAAPTLVDIPTNTDATSVVASGNYAFVGTLNQAGGEFYVYNTTTYTQAATALQFNDDIMAMAISGNYVYALVGQKKAILTIINITNPTLPTIAGTLDLGVKQAGISISLWDGYAFVGIQKSKGPEFYTINVSNPAAPTVSGSLKIGDDVAGVAVSTDGNYAYLAVNNSATQLFVVSTSNKAAPSLVTSYAVAANKGGKSITFANNYVYLGTYKGTFATINVSNPAVPTTTASFNAVDDVNGVFYFGGIVFLVNGKNSNLLRILNVNNPATITQISTINLQDAGNGVYFYNSKVFCATAYDSGELQIDTGGGGGTYFNAGTLESSTLDLGANAAINNITWTVASPSATTTQFQLAINTDNTTWNYFGPDGTANSYFALNTLIPLDHINGRYVRYKSFLTGPMSSTSVVSSVSINYSP